MKLIGALVAILGLLLTGCSSMAAEETVSVSLTPVNYTEQNYYRYFITDLSVPDAKRRGGESVNAYSAGGVMCCFDLPKVWHPGIKIKVSLRKETEAKNLKEYEKEIDAGGVPLINYEVEIPPYADGIPSTLWTLILPDNKVEVVSSRYDPNHASWPASVKGWPVPSTEYRRKLWDRDMDLILFSLKRYEDASKKSPEEAEKYKNAIEINKRRIQLLGNRP